MTKLCYTFKPTGELDTSEIVSPAGHVGDHNSIQLDLAAAEGFCPAATHYRLVFEGHMTEELYPDATGHLVYTLPQELCNSGILTFQLVGYVIDGENVTAITKTDIVSTTLNGSLKGGAVAEQDAPKALDALIASSKAAATQAKAEAQRAADCVITHADVNDEGQLVLTYADGNRVNAGNVVGPKGDTGDVNLPTATADILGGIKVGDGLQVTDDGTLSTAKRVFVTNYTVNTPIWSNQPQLIAGDGSVLKTWREDYYFAHLTQNGEFTLMAADGDVNSVVTDQNGVVLTFRFPDGSYTADNGYTLTENSPIDIYSNDGCPVLRSAGVSSVKHQLAARAATGRAPNVVEVTVTACTFNNRFNSVNLKAPIGLKADTQEYQCDGNGNNGVLISKKENLSRATLLIYATSGIIKKNCMVRLHVKWDGTSGNIWNAVMDGTIRQLDDPSLEAADAADAKANIFHRTLWQTGHLIPPDRSVCDDLSEISYSSVRGAIDIRNGSTVNIKEMIL